MHWVFKAVSITTCVLDPHPSWLVKASWRTLCSWIQKLVKSSFREGMAPMAVFHPVPKKMLLNPITLDNFFSCLQFFSFGASLLRRWSVCNFKGNKLPGPFSVGFSFRPGYKTEISMCLWIISEEIGIGMVYPFLFSLISQ